MVLPLIFLAADDSLGIFIIIITEQKLSSKKIKTFTINATSQTTLKGITIETTSGPRMLKGPEFLVAKTWTTEKHVFTRQNEISDKYVIFATKCLNLIQSKCKNKTKYKSVTNIYLLSIHMLMLKCKGKLGRRGRLL